MVPARLVEYHDDLLFPGDYHLVMDGAIMCCPGCGQRSGPRGKWTYDAATRSLSPSVKHDVELGGCGWHGHLTNGQWIGCADVDTALEQRPLVKLIILARDIMSSKVSRAKDRIFKSRVTGHYQLFCPGCQVYHAVAQGRLTNNDLERPTFSDSLGWTGPINEVVRYCHSYVEVGRIRFLDDSWHELKNQTVDLPLIV